MTIEAMKLALEALEEIHVGNMTPMAEEAWNKAITALRQAIEQAKQEPLGHISLFAYNDLQSSIYGDVAVYAEGDDETVAIYTSPPQRQWVGLTDEDLQPICDRYRVIFGSWAEDFAKAIEAKLKEKNNGL